MTPQEANKIIAEFMGLTVWSKDCELLPQDVQHTREDLLVYSKDLNALVPVWEKLGEIIQVELVPVLGEIRGVFEIHHYGKTLGRAGTYINEHKRLTIQEAAAIAAAKAIKEL